MTTSFFQQLTLFLGKAIPLSILAHLVLFNTLSFTFSARPENRNPQFIFIGPILKDQNMLGVHTEKEAVFSFFPSDDLISKTIQKSKKSFPDMSIEKSLLMGRIHSRGKTTLKSVNLIETKAPLGYKSGEIAPLDIDLTLPAYRPLRLRTP